MSLDGLIAYTVDTTCGRALPPALEDVAVGPGVRAGAYSAQAVPPVLKSSRVIVPKRYCPPLGSVAVVTWYLLIGLFKFKFDHLNTNLII
jgi:hypothetical protein